LTVSDMDRNNSISFLVNSSHRNFNHKYSTTLARDPCENTSNLSSVPDSRFVLVAILKVLKGPLNLGNLILISCKD
jgi:hypothetical protein